MLGPLCVAFAGTAEFAVPALNAVLDAGHRIAGVWTQPDRPAGRGQKLAASPVKQRAMECRLAVHQPATFKSSDVLRELEALKPDVMVVAAYGLLLTDAVLKIPRYGCINIHASLLPRWRGAAPIQRAILAGDGETGITLIQMDHGLDTGDILSVQRTEIHYDDTAQTLHDRLAKLGAVAIVELLAALPEVMRVPQQDGDATYAAKLRRDEARMVWSLPAATLERQVRAYNPWPVAHTQLRGRWLQIWDAQLIPMSVAAVPGTVIGTGPKGIDVATGTDALRIRELQAEGRKRMPAADFVHGRALMGERFI